MALKTKVNWKYRRAYNPGASLPKEQEKIMRSEIKRMRENLIRKQHALERSKEFSADEQRLHEIQNVSLRNLKTDRQVWIKWQQLRNYEESPNSSVTGKRQLRQREIESLHMRGIDFINTKNYNKFGEFMEFVRDNYSVKSIGGSDAALNYFEQHREMDINDLQRGFDEWLLST